MAGWRKFVQVGKPAPVSPGLQTVCQRWETSGLQTGFAKVCKPGRNFRRVCKIAGVRMLLPARNSYANFGVLWHFFWQFLFLVGWPTLANVCQRWLANILDSLPTGSEKIVKEPVGKLVGKQGLLKNKLGNVDDNVTSNPGFYSKK